MAGCCCLRPRASRSVGRRGRRFRQVGHKRRPLSLAARLWRRASLLWALAEAPSEQKRCLKGKRSNRESRRQVAHFTPCFRYCTPFCRTNAEASTQVRPDEALTSQRSAGPSPVRPRDPDNGVNSRLWPLRRCSSCKPSSTASSKTTWRRSTSTSRAWRDSLNTSKRSVTSPREPSAHPNAHADLLSMIQGHMNLARAKVALGPGRVGPAKYDLTERASNKIVCVRGFPFPWLRGGRAALGGRLTQFHDALSPVR